MNSVAVIGAGTMGSGIAQLAATHGCNVSLIDINADVLHRGMEEIQRQLDRLVQKARMTTGDRDQALARIDTRNEVGDLAGCEQVIEAIVEDLEIKRGLFRQLEKAASPSTVLATNTSSLSITRIADDIARPERVIGLHFFNPAPVMPLVEVIAGSRSDAAAVDMGISFVTSWGKTAVRAADTPGFIVNRVARGYYLEALRLLGEGVAGVDEIDNVMRVHGGFKMGPFELMDLVGLDVNLAVSTSVWEQMGRHARFTPHEIQRTLVKNGHLGRKTGRGFYVHDDNAPPLPATQVERRSFQLSPLLSGAIEAFAKRAGVSKAGMTEQYAFARILAAILNEAALALEEGVATREDIDIAMKLGTNYPKGPLAWADEIGPRNVRGLLKALNEAVGDNRYAPAKMFVDAL